jgi:hypothetical protein
MDAFSISPTKGFKILDKHRPVDETDSRARILFLTAGIGILSSKLLKEYMDHCDEAVINLGTKPESGTTMEQYSATVKELLTIGIWLTLFEQADHEIPTWFKEFVINCHAVADRVQPNPTAKETDEKYNLNAPIPEICTEVAINLCMQLNLGATANDALIYLGELLQKAKPERAELLEFALTQPVAALDQRIKQS